MTTSSHISNTIVCPGIDKLRRALPTAIALAVLMATFVAWHVIMSFALRSLR
jgi:hypothetical protein